MRHILFTLLFTFLFTNVVRCADSSTFWYGNRNNIEQLPTKSVGTDKIKAMDSVRGLSLAASDGTTLGYLDTTNFRLGIGTTSPGRTLTVSGVASIINPQGEEMLLIRQDDFGEVNMADGEGFRFVLDSNERFRIDSVGNIGIATIPDPLWLTNYPTIQLPNFSITGGTDANTADAYLHFNAIRENVNTTYLGDQESIRIALSNGNFILDNAPAGTGGNSVPYTRRFILENDGDVGIGTGSPQEKLEVDLGSVSTEEFIRISQADASGTNDFGIVFWSNTGGAERGRLVSSNSGDVKLNANAGTLALQTGSTDKLKIDFSGNVGIGEVSPSRKLDIKDTTANTFISVVGAPTLDVGLLLGDTDSDAQGQIYYQNNTDTLQLYANATPVAHFEADGAGNGQFSVKNTNGTLDSFIVRTDGKVGIGDTNPGALLTLAKDSNDTNTASYSGSAILLRNTDANYSKGDIIGIVGFGNDTAGFASDMRAGMYAVHSQDGSVSGNIGTTLIFRTSVQNVGIGQDRMTILDNGKVAVGASTTTYGIEAANGAVAGAGAYVDTSDERVKKNKQSLSSACSIITSLEAYYFDWKSAEETSDITGVTGGRDFAAINNIPQGYHDVGFMAQEVESIFPQAVTSNAYGLKGLQYSKLIPVMVQCLKDKEAELTAINLNFEARLQALEAAQ